MARRVCIINFKGGVGKTTLAFHLGTGLTRFHGQRVLLIDMDHQSSLSIVCLGASGWGNAVTAERTINEVFRTFLREDHGLPGAEIICQSPMKSHRYGKLHLVAASLFLDNLEIELTSTLQGHLYQSEWNKRTLICRWIDENNIDDKYDYIIFDCPPATKIVSQNAIIASHSYVISVVPEAVMERGTPHLHKMISTGIDNRMKALSSMSAVLNPTPMYVPDTKLTGVVVTRIKTSGGYSGYTNDHTQYLRSLKRQWREALVEPYIVDGVGVSEALSEGVPVYDRSNTQNVKGRKLHTLYEQLTGELKQRIDER